MVDTGAACSLINYRTFCEISQFLQPITVVRSKQKTRTYTGDEIPLLGQTTLNFSFDSDGQHCFQLQLWITETKNANLLGIEFCRKYISNSTSIFRHWNSKTLLIQFAMAVFLVPNLTAICHLSKQYGYRIRYTLMLRHLVSTNTDQKMDKQTLHQGQPS